jgi:hypothetical protein
MNRSRVASFLLATLLVLSCRTRRGETSNTRSQAALVTPLCQLVATPAAYDGKRVTVIGCVTTDDREFVVLSNLERPCSNGGLVPIETSTLKPAKRIGAVAGKKVCGTFTGTFRAMTPLHQRVLEIEETSNLQRSALK